MGVPIYNAVNDECKFFNESKKSSFPTCSNPKVAYETKTSHSFILRCDLECEYIKCSDESNNIDNLIEHNVTEDGWLCIAEDKISEILCDSEEVSIEYLKYLLSTRSFIWLDDDRIEEGIWCFEYLPNGGNDV